MSQHSPFVFWAQNEATIYLKVDLKEIKKPNIILEERKLEFKAKGLGARGMSDYAFIIDFNAPINIKKSAHKITSDCVEFTITKTEKGWWPWLLEAPQKPIWLKIDHDRFQSEDIEEEEQPPDIMNDHQNLYEKLQKEEIGYKKKDFQKVYLSIYNLVMYVGFMYVFCVLAVRYLKDGAESFPGTYAAVGPAVCFLTLLQFLEVMHPIFGYVKGGFVIPFLQIGGRALVAIFMLEFEPRLQVMHVVFYLFMTWAAVEIIRYPYYMSQLLEKENGLLTWLRYSAWIVLYPIGFICEGVILFRNIIFLEQDNRWSLEVTWPLEFTLRVSQILRLYLPIFAIPGSYILMSHMYKTRKQKIGPRPVKKSRKIK